MAGHNRAVVVINKDARQAKRADHLFSALSGKGPAIIRKYVVPGRMIAPTLRAELQEGVRNFIVGGGDGTINVIANTLAYSGATVGIIPLGTTNNFARGLGLPLNIEEAKAVIASGKSRAVNLGVVNERYFANVATIGVSAEAARAVSPEVKRVAGRAAYATAGIRQMLAHQPFYGVISANGQKRSLITHELVIANGSHHAALPLAEDVSAKGRELLITALGTSQSRWQMAGALLKLAVRSIYSQPGPLEMRSPRIKVITWPSQAVALDGEVMTTTPAAFSVALGAINVFVE